MKFTIGDNGVACKQCGHLFLTPLPQNREFTIECPNCAAKALYWIEWYINEIDDEEEMDEIENEAETIYS